MANNGSKELSIHIIVQYTETTERRFEFHKREVTGQEIREAAHLSPEVELDVMLPGGMTRVKSHEPVHIKDDERFFVVHHELNIHYTVNDEPHVTRERDLTPVKIMERAKINPAQNYLVQIIDHKEESFKEDPTKPIQMHNHMKFITKAIEPTVFTIFVDNVPIKVSQRSLTGAQIKALAGKDAQYLLYLELPGNEPDKLIGDNETVQIRDDMHFYTMPPTTFGE